ncbi:MAG: dTMP kinase [Calditrichaeota bacterium]|nr:MAG: dTMP kinase [Calditrichota bacterium]
MSGFFITFEGIDGCGKTTQAEALIERFSQIQVEYLYLREPGGTSISESVREILLDKNNTKMCDRTEILLYAAARAQIVEEIIKPGLNDGKIVVCDRYADSTAAYQGYGRQLDISIVDAAIELATGGLQPHLTFFFNLSLETATRRRTENGKGEDRLEAEGVRFYQRVSDGYLQLAQRYQQRFVTIDAEKSRGEQHEQVWEITKARALKMGLSMEAFNG